MKTIDKTIDYVGLFKGAINEFHNRDEIIISARTKLQSSYSPSDLLAVDADLERLSDQELYEVSCLNENLELLIESMTSSVLQTIREAV